MTSLTPSSDKIASREEEVDRLIIALDLLIDFLLEIDADTAAEGSQEASKPGDSQQDRSAPDQAPVTD